MSNTQPNYRECGLTADAGIHESDEAYEERMRPRIMNAPERIWLQAGCDEEVGEIHWKELSHSDVSWCDEKIHDTDVEYVRADLLTTIRQEERRAAWADAVQIAKEEAFERRLAHTVYERLIEAPAAPSPASSPESRCLVCDGPIPVGFHMCAKCGPPPDSHSVREAAEEIETRVGLLPLSLIGEIQHRRNTVYKGMEYHKHAAEMKTDLDYALAFIEALRHCSPVSAAGGDEDGPKSECCDVPVTFAHDGPICGKCGKWTTTKTAADSVGEEGK